MVCNLYEPVRTVRTSTYQYVQIYSDTNCGPTVEKTALTKDARREEQAKRSVETRWRRKEDKVWLEWRVFLYQYIPWPKRFFSSVSHPFLEFSSNLNPRRFGRGAVL